MVLVSVSPRRTVTMTRDRMCIFVLIGILCQLSMIATRPTGVFVDGRDIAILDVSGSQLYPLDETDYDLYDETSDNVNPGDVGHINVRSSGSGQLMIAERSVLTSSGPIYQVAVPLDHPEDFDYLDNPDDGGFSAIGDLAEDAGDDLRSDRVMTLGLSSAALVADLPVSDGYKIEKEDDSLPSPDDDSISATDDPAEDKESDDYDDDPGRTTMFTPTVTLSGYTKVTRSGHTKVARSGHNKVTGFKSTHPRITENEASTPFITVTNVPVSLAYQPEGRIVKSVESSDDDSGSSTSIRPSGSSHPWITASTQLTTVAKVPVTNPYQAKGKVVTSVESPNADSGSSTSLRPSGSSHFWITASTPLSTVAKVPVTNPYQAKGKVVTSVENPNDDSISASSLFPDNKVIVNHDEHGTIGVKSSGTNYIKVNEAGSDHVTLANPDKGKVVTSVESPNDDSVSPSSLIPDNKAIVNHDESGATGVKYSEGDYVKVNAAESAHRVNAAGSGHGKVNAAGSGHDKVNEAGSGHGNGKDKQMTTSSSRVTIVPVTESNSRGHRSGDRPPSLNDSSASYKRFHSNVNGFNLIVTSTVIAICLLYVYCTITVWIKKWNRCERGAVKPLLPAYDDNEKGKYPYLINIVTGSRRKAGLSSGQVRVTVKGQPIKTETLIIPADDDQSKPFERGSNKEFLYYSPVPLHDLSYVDVQLNADWDPVKWYLCYLTVTELTSRQRWYFPCDSWLLANRLIPDRQIITVNGDKKSKLFLENFWRGLLEYHIWLSPWVSHGIYKATTQWMHISLTFLAMCVFMMNHTLVYSASYLTKLAESSPRYGMFICFVVVDVLTLAIIALLQQIMKQVSGLSEAECTSTDAEIFQKVREASAKPSNDDLIESQPLGDDAEEVSKSKSFLPKWTSSWGIIRSTEKLDKQDLQSSSSESVQLDLAEQGEVAVEDEAQCPLTAKDDIVINIDVDEPRETEQLLHGAVKEGTDCQRHQVAVGAFIHDYMSKTLLPSWLAPILAAIFTVLGFTCLLICGLMGSQLNLIGSKHWAISFCLSVAVHAFIVEPIKGVIVALYWTFSKHNIVL